ncbi:MAG: hypothetical protein FH751_09805 [Firmicutes bacterium]|nr:hypothetical protein [Bacillota bacterium]
MKKTSLFTLIILLMIFGFFTLRFRSSLMEEGNPIPILSSIIKLELTNSTYQQFSKNNNQNSYVSKNNKNSRFDLVKQFMEEKNYDFIEQKGSGFVFEKEGKIVTIETRLYSKYYFLWDVPKEVFK